MRARPLSDPARHERGAIRSVTIVGGGSSGWMAATLLSSLPELHVTLVESSAIPVIGVGESTNVTMKAFHQIVPGFDEREFMRASNATFKMAIRFENFDKQGGEFFHPFGGSFIKNVDGFFRDNAQALHREYHIARQGNMFAKETVHSYHIDAGLYAEYLKRQCADQGVTHIVDTIGAIELGPTGDIVSIDTARSGKLVSDLYIDCTGFRSLLMGALKAPFLDYGKYLINDRAIAARIPYKDRRQQLHPYTNCCAMNAGWIWKIPLWSRLGTGYVYSSQFASEAEAEAEFREYLNIGAMEPVDFNHLKIRVGRHAQAWVNNCVALGLSFGFLEPLESTGLSLTQASIRDLAFALMAGGSAIEREMFNQKQREMFDRTRDFILAHYVLTQREDTPYWKYIRYSNPITEELTTILRFARHGSFRALETWQNFYTDYNWNLILSGMGFFSETKSHRAPRLPPVELHETYLQRYVHDEPTERVAPETRRERGSKRGDASRGLHPTW